MIHSECTTGLEALISGIPNINFTPFNEGVDDKNNSVVGLRNIGMQTDSIENVLQAIGSYLEKGHLDQQEPSDLKRYIDNFHLNYSAIDKILNEIDRDVDAKSKYGTGFKYFLRYIYIRLIRGRGKDKSIWPCSDTIQKYFNSFKSKDLNIKIYKDMIRIRKR